MKYDYIIVNTVNGVDCGWCETLEKAKKLVKEFEKEDSYLAKTYGWNVLPEYKIEKVQ